VRVFLDTNVLVAAFATRGLCADVLRHVLAEHELITSDLVLAELERILPKKFGISKNTLHDILILLRRYHIEPKPKVKADLPLDDSADLWILASAMAAGADVFVTGDQAILALRGRSPLAIADPRGFWELVKQAPGKE
jgi:putative PIN family toxin of toxin-antitoxin system